MLQRVFGDCNSEWCFLAQLMEAPPRDRPLRFGGNIGFRGFEIERITESEINVRVWWEVDERPMVDYSIGLYLLDQNGALAAQDDGELHDHYSGPLSTSQLEPGRVYIDLRTLPLPPDLPAGEYTLTLSVYDWRDDTRLQLPDDSELLRLDTVTLP